MEQKDLKGISPLCLLAMPKTRPLSTHGVVGSGEDPFRPQLFRLIKSSCIATAFGGGVDPGCRFMYQEVGAYRRMLNPL